MFPVLRRTLAVLIFSSFAALPVAAQSPTQIAEEEHRIYRDRMVRLFQAKAEIPDDAPLASAQRIWLLRQVGFWQQTVIDWPLARPTDLQQVLTTDPGRAVPELAVPVAQQVDAEMARVATARQDCLAEPTTACLMDAAAAHGAASISLERGQPQLLRLVPVARLAGDAARLGLLRQMAVAEIEIFDRARTLDGKSTYGGLALRSFYFRMAGFEAEAHRLARLVTTKRRVSPGSGYATIVNLLSDEYDWRQGKMKAKDLVYETQYFIDAHDHQAEAVEALVPNLLLTVMAGVEEPAAFQTRALARMEGLPAADTRNTAASLAVTLGRLGHADLLAQFHPTRVDEMLADREPAETALQTAAQLSQRMLAAGWMGRGDVAGPYRERLIDIIARIELSPDPKLGEVGQLSVPLAALAEVQAMLAP